MTAILRGVIALTSLGQYGLEKQFTLSRGSIWLGPIWLGSMWLGPMWLGPMWLAGHCFLGWICTAVPSRGSIVLLERLFSDHFAKRSFSWPFHWHRRDEEH